MSPQHSCCLCLVQEHNLGKLKNVIIRFNHWPLFLAISFSCLVSNDIWLRMISNIPSPYIIFRVDKLLFVTVSCIVQACNSASKLVESMTWKFLGRLYLCRWYGSGNIWAASEIFIVTDHVVTKHGASDNEKPCSAPSSSIPQQKARMNVWLMMMPLVTVRLSQDSNQGWGEDDQTNTVRITILIVHPGQLILGFSMLSSLQHCNWSVELWLWGLMTPSVAPWSLETLSYILLMLFHTFNFLKTRDGSLKHHSYGFFW